MVKHIASEVTIECLDLRVRNDALSWLNAGHGFTMVTVLETWGSAPRPTGALLAMRDDGMFSGSVSGGCVEDDHIARIKTGDGCDKYRPCMVAYGVSRAVAAMATALDFEVLARLHGPEGLSLGAKTPAEMTVSIVAEIVQVKTMGLQVECALIQQRAKLQWLLKRHTSHHLHPLPCLHRSMSPVIRDIEGFGLWPQTKRAHLSRAMAVGLR